MTALFNLRFWAAELLAAGLMTGMLFELGRPSAEGPEVQEADVPLPLSEELLEGCLGIWSFCRLERLERLEDEDLRFLTLERLDLDLEVLRDERTFDRRDRFLRVTFGDLSDRMSLSELELELELHPLDDGLLLSVSEVEPSSLLSELLLPEGEAFRRLSFLLRIAAGA